MPIWNQFPHIPCLYLAYLKKSLSKLSINREYAEIDSRLASGWYVDYVGNKKVKKYKTSKVAYKISKKI